MPFRYAFDWNFNWSQLSIDGGWKDGDARSNQNYQDLWSHPKI